MDKSWWLHVGYFLLGVLISAFSQVLLKKSAMRTYDAPYREYLNPWVVTGYLLFFVATFCSIAAYRVVPLSMGPLLEAAGYVFVTVFGVTIFHETIHWEKVIGLLLILIGIVVYMGDPA